MPEISRFFGIIIRMFVELDVARCSKRVEVPLVAIVRFSGDKLMHEHTYWDQASVLVQLGLLDPNSMPVVGVESARKVLDPSLPSNELIRSANEDNHSAKL